MIKHLIRHSYQLFCVLVILLLAGCATHVHQDGPPHYYKDVNKIPNAVPRKLPRSAYGNPTVYSIEGRRYHVLQSSYGYFKRGVASWYGTKFHGRLTSSHEPYDLYAMTAASTDLPIPSFVRVTNLENQKTVVVKVNDRGPFASNRIIDLSYAAAMKLGYAGKGTAYVEVKAINVDEDYSNHSFAQKTAITKHHPVETARTHLAVGPKQPRVYLQLGAFHDLTNAAYLKNHVQTFVHNKPVVILKGLSHRAPLYRVLVGPLMGVVESDQLHTRLKKLGFTKIMTVMS
jgi:rare lipoprotein A